MSEPFKITPGQWKVIDGSIITESDEFCIAVIEDDGGYEAPLEQREANAIAIAALPDLLAALRDIAAMLNLDDENSHASDDSRGAIDTAHSIAKKALKKAGAK